jgi:small subunit ribosomal protein S6
LAELQEYELAVVLTPTLTEEQVDAFVENLKTQVEAVGGTDVELDKWGKRRLAYEIQHHHEAYYVFLRFHGARDIPARLNHHLRIAEAVLRHAIVIAPPKQERTEPVVKPPRVEGTFRAPSAVANAAAPAPSPAPAAPEPEPSTPEAPAEE